ncbi:conserved exported hypothetical protein [Pseudomonas sp. 8Z]|uniref:DUF3261 domain-containing protein n=1 Tax=Pseudomonas sp. 8Z TaxID=2653166 RepID=UPI0012F3639E|nr:DUF3261 domain-containing protein [Pseudomonas sp. 8Z]VXC12982.1 conserved exported hypothetical protein [Pseudomonas sp. 8Z]
MSRLVLLFASLLLAACAARTPLPEATPTLVATLPLSLQIQRQQGESQEDWLLVIQREGQALRWSLLDPLGIPLARQRLQAGTWHNDGLLPPNPEARELFAALLFALSDDTALPRSYPADTWQRRSDGNRELAPHWRVNYRTALSFSLDKPGLSYRISVLNQEGRN